MNTSLNFHTQNGHAEATTKKCHVLAEWLKSVMPELDLPKNCTEEFWRTCLIDGTVLCRLLNRLIPNSIDEIKLKDHGSENVKKFLAAVKDMGLPRFELSDLEKGSMKPVLDCLLALRAQFIPIVSGDNFPITDPVSRFGNKTRNCSLRNPNSLLSAAPVHQVGTKFHEVFQLKQGRYADLPAAKISEMVKSKGLDNAPTQSLLSVVNGILDEGVERNNGEITQRVALLLRKVVQEIERRISTQAEHLRTQNSLSKAREEKYQSRIRVLEALAAGINQETQIVIDPVQQIKTERAKMEETKKCEERDAEQIIKEREQHNLEISKLKQELKIAKKSEEQDTEKILKEREQLNLEISKLKQELEIAKKYEQPDGDKITKERVQHNLEISKVKQELEIEKKSEAPDEEKIMKEREQLSLEISKLKQELEIAKKSEAPDEEKIMKEREQLSLEISKLKQELEIAKKSEGPDEEKIMKEREQHSLEISKLKQELEIAKKFEGQGAENIMKEREQHNLEMSKLKQELEIAKNCVGQDAEKTLKEREYHNSELSKLKKELEVTRKEHEQKCVNMENEANRRVEELEMKLKKLENLLADSRNQVKELEMTSEMRNQAWNKKEENFQKVTSFQINVLQELKLAYESIKQEIFTTQNESARDFKCIGTKLKVLKEAAENYHAVLTENRRLYNEVQDLKGNIRVFCRIRPLFAGQSETETTIEHVGDNGELVVANPSKPGKEGHRMFRFNKVYAPSASQADVFLDTQPLIRSVLDGYNVCIFAYGQTGSGKTYTMIGPNGATKEDWGVNFRALNDLFEISQSRKSLFNYEIAVQMVEIYNEQVRDLLSSDTSQKKLGVLTTSQPNGLAVPDASMLPVTSTNDVINLMDVGLNNRAMGATAMNARSSRSHSVLTIHVRGTDLKSGAVLRGSLHLVDLAGSERLDRSEATGDRLKEAQHINKSLSALGDVIFALAQKNPHVPYRNSKLTQVLQSSLGGQAKTLMFVQLNPDIKSYSESMSTLKFAERVSGVELGAAKSSKDGKDVRDLMEQVSSLRDTITKKDEEIERLQLLKDLKNVYPNSNKEKNLVSSGSFKNSNAESPRFKDDLNSPSENIRQSRIGRVVGQRSTEDADMFSPRDEDMDDIMSENSDGTVSVGTENDERGELAPRTSERSERSRSSSISSLSRPKLREPPKISGIKKSGSASSIKPSSPAKRWS